MSGKHRALPPWMAGKKEGKVTEKGPLKSRRKPKNARTVVYCMNEKELVQTAASYLTNAPPGDVTLLIDHKTCSRIQGKAGDASGRMKEYSAPSKKLSEAVQPEPSDCSETHDMTYVSETDIDITEVETVPYTRSPQHQELEGQGPGPAQTETEEKHAQMPTHATEEDDALRIVREIFFT